MTIISFPGHKWAHCAGCDAGCFLCHGGLALCSRCGGLEGSLPTDCPGDEGMTMEQQEAVYGGRLDFDRWVGWVSGTPSVHCPSGARRRR